MALIGSFGNEVREGRDAALHALPNIERMLKETGQDVSAEDVLEQVAVILREALHLPASKKKK